VQACLGHNGPIVQHGGGIGGPGEAGGAVLRRGRHDVRGHVGRCVEDLASGIDAHVLGGRKRNAVEVGSVR
jgi:hypothetical protein